MALLELKNVSRHFEVKSGLINRFIYGKPIRMIKAVENVNLIVNEKEVLGIAGESGCGKSTTCMMISGLVKPSSGKILYQGKSIDQFDSDEKRFYHSQVQMIFQDPYSSLNPRMIVKDIIREPLNINTNLTHTEKNEKIDWLLNKVGLTPEQSNRYPHEFSGGQRQRIGIARALATDPEIIIADEPVSALDVSIQAQIINLMMDLQDEFNLSIIFIAHDLSVVKHISNRVGVMYNGELVEINNTDEIFHQPEHDYTKELLKLMPKIESIYK